MSAIIRMNEARLQKYLRLSQDKVEVIYGVNHLQLKADPEKVGSLHGDGKVKNRKAGAYKAGDHVVLDLGLAVPQKYELLVEPHAALFASGMVSSPRLLAANVESQLVVSALLREDLNLSELPYLVAAYLID